MRSAGVRHAARRAVSTLAFGCGIATIVVLLGTRDLEGYEHAFFSLNRGTAVEAVHVLGQPAHTLALGLGVRLPLQGSLGASPAAALAPYLPAPLTYWLLMALAIGAAAFLVRCALEPLCGPVVSWLALVLLFCSAPMVNYTIYDDWPETAVTYAAFVACVFAPHALLALRGSPASSTAWRLACFAVAGTLCGLIALAHAGHWPLLAAALLLAWALALCRSDHPFRTRLTVVAVLAAASFMAVALQAPDILRELTAAGATESDGMRRLLEAARGSLLSANMFPFGQLGVRLPFTYLVLALVSLFIGVRSNDIPLRRLTVGAALISVLLSVGATTVSQGTSAFAPSITWALRDPAAAFAVFAAACAAAVVRKWRDAHRIVAAPALAALLLAGLQGPAYAAGLVLGEVRQGGHSLRWNQDMTAPAERASMRGVAPDRIPLGARLAIWPAVREKMRNARQPATDFADAGYVLVTAWTKQRTMRGLVEPNELLFNQTIELSPQVLCDARAVRFLQLRYLLLPPDAECASWSRTPGLLVDGWLEVGVARERDDRVHTLPVARLAQRIGREPALSAGSELIAALTPLSGTSVRLTTGGAEIRLDDPSIADGQALVLPVAYDPAWRPSSGRLHNVGGLAALVGVDEPHVTMIFVPDSVAVLRAVAMTLAQIVAVLGFLGLACVGWVATDDGIALSPAWRRGAMTRVVPVLRLLREPRDWLYLAYIAALVQQLDWRPENPMRISLPAALLLPVTALAIARVAQHVRLLRWSGAVLLAGALLRVAVGGSLAAGALHDPLFWGVLAALALGVSAATGRWPLAACAASAVAGACVMMATLLPVFPNFESELPTLALDVARRSFSLLVGHLGTLATMVLLALWLQAIAVGGSRRTRGRIGAGTRGALLAGLTLALAGAVPEGAIETGWIVTLGVLLGLAEASARAWTAQFDSARVSPQASERLQEVR